MRLYEQGKIQDKPTFLYNETYFGKRKIFRFTEIPVYTKQKNS
jgi:hypothetical protein